MALKERKKLSAIVLEELQRRSKKGLKLAKKTILKEKIECEKLENALKHYVANWNDFTHPGLISLSCEAVGGHQRDALQFQVAIAMLAAAFDIHDDIIDQSQQKHGVPTVYGKYGRDTTLLLGDAFMIKGFTLFLVSAERLGQRKKEIVNALQESLFELGNAHATELNLRSTIETFPEQYMEIVKMKAANIEADMRIGAIVGGGSSKEIKVLANYGRILGILATLREEFIDVFDVQELNQEVLAGYVPIPVLYAMQDEESKEALNSLFAKGSLTKNDVDEIVRIVFQERNTKKLHDIMKSLISEAVCSASGARNKSSRKILVYLVNSMLEDL